MRIGISSPITVTDFLSFLDDASQKKVRNITGLTAPAVDALVSGLLDKGHDLFIFTLDKAVRKPVILNGPHIRIYIGQYRTNGHIRALTFFHHEIKQLRGFIRQEKLDILHAHWSYEFAIAGFGGGIPMCLTFRDYAPYILQQSFDFYRIVRLMMNRYVISQCKQYQAIANSDYIKKLLLSKWNLESVTIPNPISPQGIIPEEQLPGHRVGKKIISISNSWGRRKNIETLLQAFVHLRKEIPDAELELVGSVFYRGDDTVERIFKEHPEWTENIILMGSIPHVQLASEIRLCAILVHPSREESFGNILLEAMGQGVPVIGGKDSGAVPSVLDQGHAGVLCDVEDPHSICDAMKTLLQDDSVWRQYSKAGYMRVVSHYATPIVVQNTEQLYLERISKK